MKRGLITWDESEISARAFEGRVERARAALSEHDLPALVVYSDLWRSNQARYLSNFMPYFNRALLVVPVEGKPTLLCGLSPRVYPWIKSVTTVEDVRSAGNFLDPLSGIAKERGWSRVGVLDFAGLPEDLHQKLRQAPFEIVDVPAGTVYDPGHDETELAVRRKAVGIARSVVAEMLPGGVGQVDYEWAGWVEGRLRRAQAEDLILLLACGGTPLTPARGRTLDDGFSVSLALEYRGHWVRITRPCVSSEAERTLRENFESALRGGPSSSAAVVLEDLGGSYPYEWLDAPDRASGSIFAMHLESEIGGRRVFYGDTCRVSPDGAAPL